MRYWVFKHTYPDATKDDHYNLIDTCLKNNFCYLHYEYGLIKNTSKVWNVIKNIKIGDVIFLFDKHNLYAYGYAKSPRRIKNTNEIFLNCNSIINKKNHEVNGTLYRHDQINDIYIYFEDCECFYENMYDDDIIPYEWKQRIDVNWKYINKNEDGDFVGIWNGGISGAQGIFIPIIEIDKEYAIKLAIKLTKNDNFKFKDNSMEELKESCIGLLKSNYNLILTGAPGTGKTYLAKQIAAKIIFNDDNKEYTEELEENEDFKNQCKFVQFHPSYDYTDFVEGLRPIKDSDGKIGFERKDGVFKEFCKNALKNRGSKFVFIIDEINRGEISKIFGELFFAIDPGYRSERGKVKTQYNNLINNDENDEDDEFEDGFFVPENVYIIGTMNDIDRSVESMDFAMRRRFAWKEVKAEDTQYMLDTMFDDNKEITEEYKQLFIEKAKKRMNDLNNAISKIEGFNSSYHIGASYFLKLKNYYNGSNENEAFNSLWENHLRGLLYEYLRGMPDAIVNLDNLEEIYNGLIDEEDDA